MLTFHFKSIKSYYKERISDRQPVSAAMRGYVGVQMRLSNKALLVREGKPITVVV